MLQKISLACLTNQSTGINMKISNPSNSNLEKKTLNDQIQIKPNQIKASDTFGEFIF